MKQFVVLPVACTLVLSLVNIETQAFLHPVSRNVLQYHKTENIVSPRRMQPVQMVFNDHHHYSNLIEASSNLLAYTDEAPDTNTLVLGTIGIFSVAIIGIFGVLAAGLSKPSAGKVELTEVEEGVVAGVMNVFDATEAEQQLTERGTVGEVNRKKKAEAAKIEYQKGKDPRTVRDRTLNYAEIELSFFIALLRNAKPQPGDVFCDLGSGAGRALFTAAKLYDWSKCVGIEFLQPLTAMANSYNGKASRVPGYKPQIELITDDFCNPEIDVSEADVLFAYSSKYDASNGIYLTELSAKLQECKPGARIITIDKRLKGPYRLIQELEDPNGDLMNLRGFVWERTEDLSFNL